MVRTDAMVNSAVVAAVRTDAMVNSAVVAAVRNRVPLLLQLELMPW